MTVTSHAKLMSWVTELIWLPYCSARRLNTSSNVAPGLRLHTFHCNSLPLNQDNALAFLPLSVRHMSVELCFYHLPFLWGLHVPPWKKRWRMRVWIFEAGKPELHYPVHVNVTVKRTKTSATVAKTYTCAKEFFLHVTATTFNFVEQDDKKKNQKKGMAIFLSILTVNHEAIKCSSMYRQS